VIIDLHNFSEKNICFTFWRYQGLEFDVRFGSQVKYVVLLCGDDEDQEIVKAAAGALAMLTSRSKKICGKVFEVRNQSPLKNCGEIMISVLLIWRKKTVLKVKLDHFFNILIFRVHNGINACWMWSQVPIMKLFFEALLLYKTWSRPVERLPSPSSSHRSLTASRHTSLVHDVSLRKLVLYL